MSDEQRLPLKIVPPLEGDYFHPDNHGGSNKIFEEPTSDFRNRLVEQLDEVGKLFADSFSKVPGVPAVARVRLRLDAVAKTHRPSRIFSDDTCPIIGAEGLGKLLVRVTPVGLAHLRRKIEDDNTQQGRANLSTLTKIEPFVPALDLPNGLDVPLKVKLFSHRHPQSDIALERAFCRMLEQFSGANSREVVYGPGVKVFRLAERSPEIIRKLSRFVGTQSVSFFPMYHPVQTQSIPIGPVTPGTFPPPDPAFDYPIVGIIDSGIRCNDGLLRPWVAGRDSFVLSAKEENSHGTFVGGLAVHAGRLNHGDPRFPSCSAKLLDIVAYPVDGTSEDDLLAIIEEVIPKYPHVKFWNLSLGTSNYISDDTFSDFAVALDHIQRMHGVVFILAAGNVSTTPLRTWPPDTESTTDRLCSPADSVRSLVVGSVAHTDHASTAARNEDPSPFSRKGPGPVYITKPDIAHYGGNCTVDGDYRQSGVMSLDGNGHLVENIGTSFSAPLVTGLAANIYSMSNIQMSANLTKALLIHSAALNADDASCSQKMNYCGFGIPPDITEILSCKPWMCTLIFEPPVHHGYEYKKIDFPIPPSLVTSSGKIQADILMTLVYDPELDASFGSEYCRTNVEVSLGTLSLNKKGRLAHHKEVGEDSASDGAQYESDRIKNKFKWSPVKVYRRSMKHGNGRDPWQLRIKMTHRDAAVPTFKQDAALIVTIIDPERRAPVYNETVARMNQLGWRAYDLTLQQRLHV